MEETKKVIIQMQPIEFNTLIGKQNPTREEIARAYIQLMEDNNFWYSQIIQYKKGEYEESIQTPEKL